MNVNDLSEQLKSFSGPQAPALPCAFGNYVLLHELATGGMGTVFIARSGGIGDIQKLSVIKTLRSHFAGDQDYVVRFMDEARIVVALDHRNICRVSDVGFTDGRYYLATEFIRGADMRAVWGRHAELGRGVPEDISLYLMTEMLEALDYAHRMKDETTGESLCLVHRDISPQNVMVGYEGEVKIIDFGLAASTMKLEKTAPQIVMGKVGYMSPEQARGDPVDKQTDLFASGVVLYEMLTGKRFYDGMGAHQIWAVVGTGEHVPTYLGSLDNDVQTILKKALHADKAQRYADCAEFRRALLDLAYERRHRVGAPELRKSMEESFTLEIFALRERVAAFNQMTDVSTTSGPALAAAGKHEAEVTQTSSGMVDTGETRTEKVAPSHLVVFDDDGAALKGPNRTQLALGVGVACALALAVVFAVAFGSGEEEPPPLVTTVEVATTPPTGVQKPPTENPSTQTDDGFETPASATSTTTKPPATKPKPKKPTAKKPAVERKPRKRNPRRKATRTQKRPVKQPLRKPIAKKPPPPTKGSIKQKMSYLKKWCPHTNCTRWLKKRDGKFKFIDPPEVAQFMRKLPVCLKSCGKR